MRWKPKNTVHRKLKTEWLVYISIAIITVLLNVLAWNSTAFCDAYITYIFPIWVNTYGRFTGLFPFSVGEYLLVAGVTLIAAMVLAGIVALMCICVRKTAQKNGIQQETVNVPVDVVKARVTVCNKILASVRGYYHFFAWLFLGVCLIMTLNCTILYHASTFSEKYFGQAQEDTLEELITVYNHVATRCNELSSVVERDSKGSIVYENGVNEAGKIVDMEDKAIEAMQQLGITYPQLDGYYPRPKPMLFSDFMCQQYMCGYYFPFSMEANYNDVMHIMNKPVTMCHELAHLRGYIFEDEANFISFLACVQSEDVTFQYAGYLSVLNYLINDINNAASTNKKQYKEAIATVSPIPVFSTVIEDNVFVTEEEWKRINEKALLDTETVDEISDTFTDTTLKINGVSDGVISYSRVVHLLLQYYREVGVI